MNTTDCAIEARQLVKTYAVRGAKHGIRALDGLDLAVPRGMIFGLLGPNGAGKTTTVKILTSLARPDGGTARVEGIDVLARPGQVRHVIGVVAQRSGADPTATGRENLILQGRLYGMRGGSVRARADELLGHFELTEAAGRLVKTYSGGMQRRLDVALGLMHRPAVLFLDEPTTGLDPSGRSDLWALIGELVADGTTVLLTTQYLEEADRLANHIVVIDHGRIIAEGTPVELKAGLGSTVVEIRVADPADVQRAAARLQPIAPTGILDGSRTLAVKVPDKGPSVQQVIRLLDDGAIVPESLAIREPTLDDVFLQLTGHHPGAGPSAPAAVGSGINQGGAS